MPREEWLLLDNQYSKEQALRTHLLENQRREVFQYRPGSELACKEMLEEVVSFFTRRYPQFFYHPNGETDKIHNALTKKTFRIHEPFDIHPLEVAAQLTMEDMNLLVQGGGADPDQFYL